MSSGHAAVLAPRPVPPRVGFLGVGWIGRHRLQGLVDVTFEEGLRELAEWLAGQTAEDRVLDASRELDARGLTMGGGAA